MQRLRGKDILVLEDKPLITLMLEGDLTVAGAAVISTTTASKALEAVSCMNFDAATLDRHGDGDCKAVAELLRQQGTPFIVTTGEVHADDFGAAARLN
jgi:DNA-binding response OmpR family regulator